MRVLEAGNQLELTNRSGQEVIVLGYRSEPYLRVGPTGGYENQRSPSAYPNRFANPPSASQQSWTRPPRHGGAGSRKHQRQCGMTIAATGAAPTRRRSPPGRRPHLADPHAAGPAHRADRGRHRLGTRSLALAVGSARAGRLRGGASRLAQLGLLALLVGVAVAFDLVHTVGEFAASTAPVVAKVYAP